jgi:hypothetical protein
MKKQYLVIAGTEKAGTTSLYQYLMDSKLFNPSIKKETDYLRGGEVSKLKYDEEFIYENDLIKLEGSPGYLADSALVHQNIKKIGVDERVLLIFLLRSPLSRLKSSFLFHKSRLYLDKNLSFDDYITECKRFERDPSYASKSSIGEWFLRVPDSGLYFKHLSDFEGLDLLVFTQKELLQRPNDVIDKIFGALSLDSSFFENYDFKKSNVTAGFKFVILQKIALFFNKKFESFFFAHPELKRKLLKIYFLINGGKKEVISMNESTREFLLSYYSGDIDMLLQNGVIDEHTYVEWIEELKNA